MRTSWFHNIIKLSFIFAKNTSLLFSNCFNFAVICPSVFCPIGSFASLQTFEHVTLLKSLNTFPREGDTKVEDKNETTANERQVKRVNHIKGQLITCKDS